LRRVAVIGGAGDMGRWVARHFSRMGYNVVISDVRRDDVRKVAEELQVDVAVDNVEAVRKADITILCVPPETVPDVVDEILSHLKPGSTLVEISSVKTGLTDCLRKALRAGVKVLSVHPLFGPGAPSPRGFRVALIPLQDPKVEREEAERIFPGAEIVETTLEEHEEAMSYTLALNYIINTALALTLKGVNLKRLRKLSGPTFAAQLSLSEAVTRTNPNISAAIMTRNAYTLKTLSRYVQNLKALMDAVEEGKTEKLIEMLREAKATLTKDPEYDEAYKKLYRMLQPRGSQSL